jgi:hypothetical protein
MIRRLFCYGLLAGTLAAPCAHAQDAAAAIKTAEYSLGMIRGPQRIDAISTLEYWGTGSIYAYGGSSDLPLTAFKLTYHASLSYAVPAMRVDMMVSNPDKVVPDGRGPPLAAPQRQIEVVGAKFAWNESVPGAGFIPGSTATPTPAALKVRLLKLWITPFGVLKMAAQASSRAKITTEGGATVITFPLTGTLEGITVKATLNAKNQVERVETLTDNPMLGYLVTETTYSDYKDLGEIASDVLFPSHIVQKQRGVPVLDLTITKTDPNNPYVVFPVPDSVERAP